MAQGKKGVDTDQMIKIMTIGIIATLVIVIVIGVFVGLKYIMPENGGSLFSSQEDNGENYPSSYPDNPYTPSPGNSQGSSPETEGTGVRDSAVVINGFIPDDPVFNNTDFDTKTPPEQPIEIERLQTLYQDSISMKYTAMSIKATAGKGPLVIYYDVTDTVIGPNETEINPYFSFLNINVTDYNTGEPVAEGGYARQYSVEDEQSIKIYQAGVFRINIYGNGLDVDLKVKSGIPKDSGSLTEISGENTVGEYPEDSVW
ncbi:hypothetical protein J2128_002376 [Methanomicrobium sp. W14]|uniref:hypothetical protein n=1 Tax=Methanomicrobium sp. W14 TaxID=2817839 RepID=UPI001AE5367D|nr:hypothetical protein [Methanomicrobium sp. W14]MBP2134410.1 hypothetical protein [Methanomicrobium sp. W14]